MMENANENGMVDQAPRQNVPSILIDVGNFGDIGAVPVNVG